MLKYVYDLECLRNFFSATFVNTEDENDKLVFCIGLGRDDRTSLIKFLLDETILIGYNNYSYDDAMLRFIMGYRGDKLNQELYKLSGELIDKSFQNETRIMELRYPKKVIYPWKSVDLMKMLGFDVKGVSLKQVAINLKWHRIQDMPVDHSASTNASQLDMILDYNLNDVLITKRLYEEIAPLRELRTGLEKIYHIDFSSASKSKIGNLIFEKYYAEEMHVDVRKFKDLRTKRNKIFLGDCIAKFVKFKTPELNEFLDRISSSYVYEYNKYKYSEKVYFANCVFSMGIGGIHSDDDPGIFVTDDNYIIRDMDVSSYYPNLIINNNFFPQHLGPNFIKVLRKITEERILAKKAGDKIKAESLKIAVNSIFGKLAYPHYWLLDAKQLISTTVSGQLGLLMLIENLYLNGIEVLSCNTDGVICKIPRNLESKYYEIAHSWEKETNLELEFNPYKKYVRRDVNSYVTQQENGDIKEKNCFLTKTDVNMGYQAHHMPIVAKALCAYYIEGIPIKETIMSCRDIMDFCISQKTGDDFNIELHTTKGIEKLQKTNRFYISKKGASLIKRERFSKRMTGMYVGKLVRILNDYDTAIPFENYDIDFAFYEKEAMKIIDAIEPKQIPLFDLSALTKSKITKMQLPVTENKTEEREFSVYELNKLGKNQLLKKIEDIANSHQIIKKISPRYVFITSFDRRTMVAEVYCLAKGINQTISIDRKAFKQVRLDKGMLVYCTLFSRNENGNVIMGYKVTEKIEEEKDRLME